MKRKWQLAFPLFCFCFRANARIFDTLNGIDFLSYSYKKLRKQIRFCKDNYLKK